MRHRNRRILWYLTNNDSNELNSLINSKENKLIEFENNNKQSFSIEEVKNTDKDKFQSKKNQFTKEEDVLKQIEIEIIQNKEYLDNVINFSNEYEVNQINSDIMNIILQDFKNNLFSSNSNSNEESKTENQNEKSYLNFYILITSQFILLLYFTFFITIVIPQIILFLLSIFTKKLLFVIFIFFILENGIFILFGVNLNVVNNIKKLLSFFSFIDYKQSFIKLFKLIFFKSSDEDIQNSTPYPNAEEAEGLLEYSTN